MRLYILFGHRKESFLGEFGPEALEVMDEFSYEDNPRWLHDKLEYHKQKDKTFRVLEIITVEVSELEVMKLLRTSISEIKGEVQDVMNTNKKNIRAK